MGILHASLGKTLQALSELEAAKAEFEQALGIFERSYPPGHENIQHLRDDLEAVEGEMRKRKLT